ncbi:MAG: hypothetical protein P8Y47_06835 [Alphaproteobacteria bacterium]
MSWKTDLKLADLDAHTQVECTCKHCGHTHYKDSSHLMRAPEDGQLYLDEVETRLVCAKPFCRGPVRIALLFDETEGFVGGMA